MEEFKLSRQEHIGNLIKEIQQAVSKERNRYWAKYGLTASQTDVLLLVLRSQDQEINQIDIQRRLHLSNPTVAGIIKRLEARGFVEKHPSEKDARYNAIRPTEKAYTHHQEGTSSPQMIDEYFLDGLSDEDCTALESYLNTILRNMRGIQATHLTEDLWL